MKRNGLPTLVFAAFALLVALSAAWLDRKRRTLNRRIQAWLLLTNT